jgi:hypothetical protein
MLVENGASRGFSGLSNTQFCNSVACHKISGYLGIPLRWSEHGEPHVGSQVLRRSQSAQGARSLEKT